MEGSSVVGDVEEIGVGWGCCVVWEFPTPVAVRCNSTAAAVVLRVGLGAADLTWGPSFWR